MYEHLKYTTKIKPVFHAQYCYLVECGSSVGIAQVFLLCYKDNIYQTLQQYLSQKKKKNRVANRNKKGSNRAKK